MKYLSEVGHILKNETYLLKWETVILNTFELNLILKWYTKFNCSIYAQKQIKAVISDRLIY